MKKNLLYIILIVIIGFLINCAGKKNLVNNEPIIILRTTACNGVCPVYTLKIFPDGKAMYIGESFTDKIGKYMGNVEKSKLEEIINKFDKIIFFELNDSYTSLMMDLPGKYITYYKNGNKKEILAYDKVPKELTKLIKEIEMLSENINWEKVD